MMPLGPQLVRELHINTHEFGLLLSSYTFTAAVSGLIAATYIDRFDRRTLMLVLYTLFIVATFFCGLAPNYSALLVARALAGAFGGILSGLAQTMIADVVPFERRGQAMGSMMTAFSISTVVGVPLGLFLAQHIPALGWRMPFFFIATLSGVFLFIGYRLLPSLTSHLQQTRQGNFFQQIYTVAKEPEHLKAYLFIVLLVMMSFTVVPYFALYYTANVGMTENFITLLYLVGGASTLFTSRLIGKLTDRYGKLRAFRWVVLTSFVPLLVTTHLVPVPWWVVLINSTAFFILGPGRMIPGMAMVMDAAASHVRGTFMSLGSSVQMMSSGLASLISGLIISRNAMGQVEHFNIVGYIAVACGVASLWLASRLPHAQAPQTSPDKQARLRA